MTVYVLVEEYTNVDVGDYATNVCGVYENFEDAQRHLEDTMVDIRKYFEDYDYEEQQYSHGDMEWSIWEKDCWSTYHDRLIIVEKEVI